MHELIEEYSAYDHWANGLLHDRLKDAPSEALDAMIVSSFPSIRSTLMHIRNAEATWLARMTGAMVKWPAEPGEELGTFLTHVQRMRDHVRSLSVNDLTEVITYTDLRGRAHAQTRWRILMHCFNHSTYHRGQVVTMMRQLELLPVPAMDLVVFQRLRAGGRA